MSLRKEVGDRSQQLLELGQLTIRVGAAVIRKEGRHRVSRRSVMYPGAQTCQLRPATPGVQDMRLSYVQSCK